MIETVSNKFTIINERIYNQKDRMIAVLALYLVVLTITFTTINAIRQFIARQSSSYRNQRQCCRRRSSILRPCPPLSAHNPRPSCRFLQCARPVFVSPRAEMIWLHWVHFVTWGHFLRMVHANLQRLQEYKPSGCTAVVGHSKDAGTPVQLRSFQRDISCRQFLTCSGGFVRSQSDPKSN